METISRMFLAVGRLQLKSGVDLRPLLEGF